jgi:AraC-like DNA-binding protein
MTYIPLSFDSSKLPFENRQGAFARFCDTSPNKYLSDHVISPVSSDNAEIHKAVVKKAETALGDKVLLATTYSSGYSMTYERQSLSTNRMVPVSVGLIEAGSFQSEGAQGSNRLSAGDVYVTTLKSNKFTVGESVVTRILFADAALQQPTDVNGKLVVLQRSTPMGKLLATAVKAVKQSFDDVDEPEAADKLNLIAKEIALRALNIGMTPPYTSTTARQRERARRFVMDNLSDTSLSPAIISSYLGMSRAAVFRLFAQDGGVMSFVTSVRMEVARSMLEADHADKIRVSEVAHLCGFTSPSHFSASFKKSFGWAPSKPRNFGKTYATKMRSVPTT